MLRFWKPLFLIDFRKQGACFWPRMSRKRLILTFSYAARPKTPPAFSKIAPKLKFSKTPHVFLVPAAHKTRVVFSGPAIRKTRMAF